MEILEDITVTVEIPSDDEGYVLLQCSICGNFFKATPRDIEDDGVLHLFCPSCGLSGDSFVTDDVLELGATMLNNKVVDAIYDQFKDMERKTRKGPISVKAGKKPKHEPTDPIRSGIEALEVVGFMCCKRTAKVKPMFKMTGCYCPFCGVKNYEFE